MSLFSLSGGLVYHARAARYRGSLWLPFRQALRGWLAQQLPAGDELLLVGPSAGHCLPLDTLRRFRRISVLEPDPVARALLRHGLQHPRIELEHRDLLLGPLLRGAVGLDAVLARRPRAAVLFCNMLGQLQFGLSDEQEARFQAEFRRRLWPLLEGRSWASFHDRWALDGAPGVAAPSALAFPHLPSNDELGVAWFGAAGAPITAFDHGTSQLFPAAWPRRYFGWQLTPQAYHLVEALGSPLPNAPRG